MKYLELFVHEDSICREPNPESERHMFEAVIKSKYLK